MSKEIKALGLIGIATKAGRIAYGTEAVKETIENKKANLVIIATDASDKTKENIRHKCTKSKIPVAVFGTIETISKTIGKQNKAVISVKDRNLGEEIFKIICGGEAIG